MNVPTLQKSLISYQHKFSFDPTKHLGHWRFNFIQNDYKALVFTVHQVFGKDLFLVRAQSLAVQTVDHIVLGQVCLLIEQLCIAKMAKMFIYFIYYFIIVFS